MRPAQIHTTQHTQPSAQIRHPARGKNHTRPRCCVARARVSPCFYESLVTLCGEDRVFVCVYDGCTSRIHIPTATARRVHEECVVHINWDFWCGGCCALMYQYWRWPLSVLSDAAACVRFSALTRCANPVVGQRALDAGMLVVLGDTGGSRGVERECVYL